MKVAANGAKNGCVSTEIRLCNLLGCQDKRQNAIIFAFRRGSEGVSDAFRGLLEPTEGVEPPNADYKTAVLPLELYRHGREDGT